MPRIFLDKFHAVVHEDDLQLQMPNFMTFFVLQTFVLDKYFGCSFLLRVGSFLLTVDGFFTYS